MDAVTYGREHSVRSRNWIAQIAVTVFVGIPMTLGLTVALAFYCTYECLKFAISTKSPASPSSASHENTFTASLSRFASIHPPSQPVKPLSEKAGAADHDSEQSSTTAANKAS